MSFPLQAEGNGSWSPLLLHGWEQSPVILVSLTQYFLILAGRWGGNFPLRHLQGKGTRAHDVFVLHNPCMVNQAAPPPRELRLNRELQVGSQHPVHFPVDPHTCMHVNCQTVCLHGNHLGLSSVWGSHSIQC